MEESRESKGQSWLGMRASSTSLANSESENDRIAKDYGDDSEDSDSDDGILHIGQGRKKKSPYIIHHSKSRRDEYEIQAAETRSGNRFIGFVDWMLGLGDDAAGLSEVWDNSRRRQLAKEEKVSIRDEEQSGKLDIAWVLGVVSEFV